MGRPRLSYLTSPLVASASGCGSWWGPSYWLTGLAPKSLVMCSSQTTQGLRLSAIALALPDSVVCNCRGVGPTRDSIECNLPGLRIRFGVRLATIYAGPRAWFGHSIHYKAYITKF